MTQPGQGAPSHLDTRADLDRWLACVEETLDVLRQEITKQQTGGTT